MQLRAHFSAASSRRPASRSSSCSSLGRCSGETSIRTWFSDASLCSPISWRSSATIETSPTFGRSALARSSISAAVAPRPAKTPKFTRTSTPGGSISRTQNASCGSLTICNSYYLRRLDLTSLMRLPAEIAKSDDHACNAPSGHDSHVRALRPDLVPVQHHVAHETQEVGQRQHVGDSAQNGREMVRREEGAGDERH